MSHIITENQSHYHLHAMNKKSNPFAHETCINRKGNKHRTMKIRTNMPLGVPTDPKHDKYRRFLLPIHTCLHRNLIAMY